MSVLAWHGALQADEIRKNGVDRIIDCVEVNRQGLDRYDDTYALPGDGMAGGLRMYNLAVAVSETTYPDYQGSPIDNNYVSGNSARRFAPTTKTSDTYGPGHTAVSTVNGSP